MNKTVMNKFGILKILAVFAAIVMSVPIVLACNAKSKVELELDTTGVKTEYAVNDNFSSSGLAVTATIDGERFSVPASECDIAVPDMSVAGEKTVTVSFMGGSASYDITVIAVQLMSITVDAAAAKTGYLQGEQFSTAGLVVKAEYSYGDPKKVPLSECEFSGFDGNVVGKQTVTVTYESKTASYTVNVVSNTITGLRVDYSNNVKREYVVNVPFTYENLKVFAVYGGVTEKELSTDDYTVSQPDMSTIGVKTVTVTYKSDSTVSTSYQIYAIPDVPWETNRLEFSNQSGTGDSLDLFVTSLTTGNNRVDTEGWYLLKRVDGTYKMYKFLFSFEADKPNDEQCKFMTEGLTNEYLDNNQNGDMFVVIGNITFRKDSTSWHAVILGWR